MTDELNEMVKKRIKPVNYPPDATDVATSHQIRIPIFHDHTRYQAGTPNYASGDMFMESIYAKDLGGNVTSGRATMIYKLPNNCSAWVQITRFQCFWFTQSLKDDGGMGLIAPAIYVNYMKRTPPATFNPFTSQIPPEGEGVPGLAVMGWHNGYTTAKTITNNFITGAAAGHRYISVKLTGIYRVANGQECKWVQRTQEFKKDSDIIGKRPHQMAASPMDSGMAPYLVLTAVTG
jgi:hypothetical protein